MKQKKNISQTVVTHRFFCVCTHTFILQKPFDESTHQMHTVSWVLFVIFDVHNRDRACEFPIHNKTEWKILQAFVSISLSLARSFARRSLCLFTFFCSRRWMGSLIAVQVLNHIKVLWFKNTFYQGNHKILFTTTIFFPSHFLSVSNGKKCIQCAKMIRFVLLFSLSLKYIFLHFVFVSYFSYAA